MRSGGRSGGNPKRDAKDSKYGFGGRKRAGKRNDATSSADMEGFRTSRPEGRGVLQSCLHLHHCPMNFCVM